MESGVYVAPRAQQTSLLLEIACVLLDKEKAVPKIRIVPLVSRGREVLRHERCVNADEMSPIEGGTNRQIEFGTAAKLAIEPAKNTQSICPRHERAAP